MGWDFVDVSDRFPQLVKLWVTRGCVISCWLDSESSACPRVFLTDFGNNILL